MNEEMIKEVLEDVLQELKDSNQQLKEMQGRVTSLSEKVDGFEQQLKDQQVIVEPVDLGPALEILRTEATAMFIRESGVADFARGQLQVEVGKLRTDTGKCITAVGAAVKEGVERIDKAAAEQKKPIVREYRVVLFKNDENYKHFIEWLFGGIVALMVVAAIFFLGKQYIAKMEPVKVEQKQGWVGLDERPAAAASVNDKPLTSHRGGGARTRMLPYKHGLTTEEARRKVDSMVAAEKARKRLEAMSYKERNDSIRKVLMEYLADSTQDPSH